MNETLAPPEETSCDESVRARLSDLTTALQAGLIGRAPMVQTMLIGLLTNGHILLEGAPGLAKTRAVKLLAEAMDCTFARIQCTPDLMPADLTGTQVFRPDTGAFEFVPGPVFHQLVLVDEINRAPPKVQSALLEAMAEQQVTSAGVAFPLPKPFMAIATQNPIEQEGTFPLPEAQLDRFLLHTILTFPDADAERQIIDLFETETQTATEPLAPVMTAPQIRKAQAEAARTHFAPALKDFVVRLVMATREPAELTQYRDAIAHAVSPRGTLAIVSAAKARAYLEGRDAVLPEDVAAVAEDALAHRLSLTWAAIADGVTSRQVIRHVLDSVHPL